MRRWRKRRGRSLLVLDCAYRYRWLIITNVTVAHSLLHRKCRLRPHLIFIRPQPTLTRCQSRLVHIFELISILGQDMIAIRIINNIFLHSRPVTISIWSLVLINVQHRLNQHLGHLSVLIILILWVLFWVFWTQIGFIIESILYCPSIWFLWWFLQFID